MYYTTIQRNKNERKRLEETGWVFKKQINDVMVEMEKLDTKRLREEKLSLEDWFIKYDTEMNKYNREVRMHLFITVDIAKLDFEAEEKRKQLRDINMYLKKETKYD